MKHFTSLIFALLGLTAVAQTVDFGMPKKEKLFNSFVGFSVCPISETYWDTHGYVDEGSNSSLLRPIFLWPSGFRYSCLFQNRFGFEAGLNYSVETDKVENADYYPTPSERRIKTINYREDFLQVPLQLVIYPYSKKGLSKYKSLFFIKLGASFDFLVSDRTTASSHAYYDAHFPLVGGIVPGYSEESAGKNKNNFRFNRISPLFSVGETVKCSERTTINLNFFMLQLMPLYQKKNTVEYLTNARSAFLCIGINYKI